MPTKQQLLERSTDDLSFGYKVVLASSRLSAIMGLYGFERNAAVFYEFNQWVFPRVGHGPLAVFRSKREAQAFIEREVQFETVDSRMVAYRCIYQPDPEAGALWRPNDVPMPLTICPKGTALAKRVMILQ